MKLILWALGLTASFTLTACSPTSHQGTEGGRLAESIQSFLRSSLKFNQILVTDRFGTPLAGASVLIGQALNDPFAGNYVSTNSQGILTIPSGWMSKQHVTIESVGLVRTTFLDVQPQSQILELNEAEGRSQLEVSGQTSGWTDVKKDGFVDFSIIMPTANRSSLFQFNVSDMLSPEVDVVTAYGQDIYIPSNFSLPKQTENYGLFPVTIDKLLYRAYVNMPDQYRFVAGRGKFPFKTVLKKLENGSSYWDVLNDMDFISAGTGSVLVNQIKNALDLSIAGHPISPTVHITATGIPNGNSFLAAIWNEDQGTLFPSDVKTFVNNETRVMESTGAKSAYVLSVLGKYKVLQNSMITLEEQSSRAITPITATAITPEHLDLINTPTFNGEVVQAVPPNFKKGMSAVGTMVVIYDVDKSSATQHESKTRLWEVYGQSWLPNVDLPQWPTPIGQSLSKRVEIMYLAAPNTISAVAPIGPSMVDLSTHATKNALDF